MAIIKPFKGIRPKPGFEQEIVFEPQDFLDSAHAVLHEKGLPYSFIHSEGEPENGEAESNDPYDIALMQKAREHFDDFLAEGKLVQDDGECYYIYAQEWRGKRQYGIVAAVHIDEYLNETIKKHEQTRADKEMACVSLLDILNANTCPVFLTYQDDAFLNDLVSRIAGEGEALYDFMADGSVRHLFWVVSEEEDKQAVTQAFSSIQSSYIADGHHRSASCALVGSRRRAANRDHRGDEGYNYFLAAFFPASQLQIFPYHRLVKDLNGLDSISFIAELSKEVRVLESPVPVIPEQERELGLYLKGAWYRLLIEDATLTATDTVNTLDVRLLSEKILRPILGIKDIRTDPRIDFAGGIYPVEQLQAKVDEGEYGALFMLFPVSIGQIMTVSDEGQVMPPKATWFEPKLRSGIITRRIDE